MGGWEAREWRGAERRGAEGMEGNIRRRKNARKRAGELGKERTGVVVEVNKGEWGAVPRTTICQPTPLPSGTSATIRLEVEALDRTTHRRTAG